MYDTKFEEYEMMIGNSYQENVYYLLQKYGGVIDDYYREKSYERFLNNEIKHITKGKYSRTNDGLVVHHINENKYLNLVDKDFIMANKYPYELQRKEQLVYCDLFEHLILHAIISNETNGKFGAPGYCAYIFPMVFEWFSYERLPQSQWKLNCYNKAYLPKDLTRKLLVKIDQLLPKQYQSSYEFLTMDEEDYYILKAEE
ncbi:hypothetical protein ACN68H_06605 [Aerococcus viridans]|uniref:hypothetical protein n=1 Tax=Aerococcus urinaeequi TaxID=51665 RepID=UPI003B546B27